MEKSTQQGSTNPFEDDTPRSMGSHNRQNQVFPGHNYGGAYAGKSQASYRSNQYGDSHYGASVSSSQYAPQFNEVSGYNKGSSNGREGYYGPTGRNESDAYGMPRQNHAASSNGRYGSARGYGDDYTQKSDQYPNRRADYSNPSDDRRQLFGDTAERYNNTSGRDRYGRPVDQRNEPNRYLDDDDAYGEDPVAGIKQQISHVKQDTLASTRNAVMKLQESKEAAGSTMDMLGNQAAQLATVDRHMDRAKAGSDVAADQTSELKKLNRSIFIPAWSNPFTKGRRERREIEHLNAVAHEREQSAMENRKYQHESQKRVEHVQKSAQAGYRSADEEDDTMEDEIDRNLDIMSSALRDLKNIAINMNAEVEEQSKMLDRIDRKIDPISEDLPLSMAEICSAFPTSGGLYYWSAALSTPKWAPMASFFCAWFNLIGQICGSAAVDYGLALVVTATISIGTDLTWTPTAGATVGIYIGILVLNGLINTFGVKAIGWMNIVSMYWHLFGTLIIIISLLVGTRGRHASATFVFTDYENNTGWSNNGFVILLGLLQSQYSMTGYDSSAHMTEETKDAQRSGPRSILFSILVTAIAGLAFLLAVTFSVQDYDRVISSPTGLPIAQVFLDAVGKTGAILLMCIIIVGVFFCGNAVVTSNARLIYALSRDGACPRFLHKLSPRTQTPILAVWALVFVAAVLGLLNLGSSTAFVAITSVATISLYVTYGFPTLCLMFTRSKFHPGPFNLGRYSVINGAIAIAWIAFISVLFVLPTLYPVTAENMNYAIAIFGALWILVGFYWIVWGRRIFKGPGRYAVDRNVNDDVQEDEQEDHQEKLATLIVVPHAQQSLLDDGDKIVLPPSSLEQLLSQSAAPTPTITQKTAEQGRPRKERAVVDNSDSDDSDMSDIDYIPSTTPHSAEPAGLPSPLTFQLIHPSSRNINHGGVKEFSAEDGTCSIPTWMRQSLDLKEGDPVVIRFKTLPKGTWARLRPISADYKDILDYRAAFESYLRSNYNTLTTGEMLSIRHGAKRYQFLVEELKPERAVCVTDTDLEVDLEPIANNKTSINHVLGHIDIATGKLVSADGAKETVPKAFLIGTTYTGVIEEGSDVVYRLDSIQHPCSVEFHFTAESGDADLLVHTEEHPSLVDHTWSLLNATSRTQTLTITSNNVDFADKKTLYIAVHAYKAPARYSLSGKVSALVPTETPSPSGPLPDAPAGGTKQCSNCHTFVPEASFRLHEAVCLRNNVACPQCHKVFRKGSDDYNKHWHCPVDGCSFSGDESAKAKHDLYFHSPHDCSCGKTTVSSIPSLAQHRRTDCKDKLIICRYCHLLQPQGPPPETAQDLLAGLHAHESYCGGRTIDCAKCGQPVKIKEMQLHAKMHEVQRQNQPLPVLCSNQNCIRSASQNVLSLCSNCFGPFWMTTEDRGHVKLIQKLARKYHTQLTLGCGHAWCQNPYCATSRGQTADATTAASELIPLITPVQRHITSLKYNTPPPLYLCVDEMTTKRRSAAKEIHDALGQRYHINWCIRGVEVEKGDTEKAMRWVNMNAPHWLTDRQVLYSLKPLMTFDKENEAFLSWLKGEGATISDKIAIHDYTSEGAGRGVIAKADISENEELFSLPRSVLLAVQTSTLKDQPALKEVLDELNGWNPLILSMMYESGKSDSRWKPYFDILPKSLDTPMFWDQNDLKHLKATGVIGKYKIGKEDADANFKGALLPIIKAKAKPVPIDDSARHDMDDEDSDDEEPPNVISMVPLADTLNHKTGHNNARLFYDSSIHLVMRAIHPIPVGNQIFNTYSDLCNADLLRKYGFVDVDNPHDIVEINGEQVVEMCTEGMNPKEKKKKISFLTEADVVEDVFVIDAEGMDQGLIHTVNILLMSSEEWATVDKTELEESLTDHPEIKYPQVVRKILEKRLAEYDTDLKTDQEELTTLSNSTDLHQIRHLHALIVRIGEKQLLERELKALLKRKGEPLEHAQLKK
ncbi:hypothetical protein BZG36_00020 [Bifiguratus adelaidae]|uniref:SET domain-containing protein n=1 Tax=Bifiguratus adelaidae TaxID=1938954 RepID=A0A261Y8D2_9FUNG|nr:hypothetical protein BZG36_00020 [Bifiguratus adelaidae]